MPDGSAWIFGATAAVLHAVGYVLYNRQAKRGDSRPNAVSWGVWAFMAVLNAFSFAEVTDLARALQYVVGTFAASATFILSLCWGRFDRPTRKEMLIFFICMFAVGVWWQYKAAATANVLGMSAFLISFWPTCKGVYFQPDKERPLPWVIWTIAFAVNLVNNLVHWEGSAVALGNPAILLLCHGSIAVLSRRSRRRTSS